MVPQKLRDRFNEIVALIDTFCDTQLNDEYKQVCCDMADALHEEGAPIESGKAAGWAAGVVFSVGFVNFLSDPNHTPFMTGEQIAKGFGVSEATLMNRSRIIRKGLDIIRFDPEWTLPSRLESNPLNWFVPLKNGMIIDARSAPVEFQKSAYEAGLIPFIPTKREPHRIKLAPNTEPQLPAKPKKSTTATKPNNCKPNVGPILF